jgi:hypothetical protein
MLTREDLLGAPLGKNKYGNMMYEKGLIEQYLPGEFDYHGQGNEGQFLASLCLYLLSATEDPSPFFSEEYNSNELLSNKNALVFLNYLVFHNIPKQDFLDEMAKHEEEGDKVKAVCELINSRIRLAKPDEHDPKHRFHDVYVNSFGSLSQGANSAQLKAFCTFFIPLVKKTDESVVISWKAFKESCENQEIIFSEDDFLEDAFFEEDLPEGNPITELQNRLSAYLIQRIDVKDPKTNEVKEYYCNFFTCFQKSFTQKRAALTALGEALSENPQENLDLISHLPVLRDGNLGKTIRAFVKSGQADSIVDVKVTTVTEFVIAIQNKISPPNIHKL